ncbi:ATP-dependent DNA helicase DDX31 [Oratosquilla oratoria]|uniref:ATP-dependent DNA helicase DDX31 n=1 Tax=Oratosquilla oratoria TaxID=337810 RepID=UPI003F7748EE
MVEETQSSLVLNFREYEEKTPKKPEAPLPTKRPIEDDAGGQVKKRPHRDDGSKTEEGHEGQKREGFTSLFSGNPEIPFVPPVDITPVSEKVFSENAFNSLPVAKQIVSNVEKLGFTSMTMVQQLSIPHILEGKDALIKSQTGSGKTLTYALPVIHNLMNHNPRVNRADGMYALVIVPTRELALQSYQWFEKLCKSCVWVVPGYLIGGEKKKAEKSRLRKGVNILIATPGRLIDHIHHTKSLSLEKLKYLIIDEADRLLDMGYEQSITSIMEAVAEQQKSITYTRQTVMLSATLTSGVEKLAGMSLQNPKIVDVSDVDGSLKGETLVTPENLSHFYLLVPAKLRLVCLAAFILLKCRFGKERKMIVFMSTQDMVDYHTALFKAVLSRYGHEKTKKTSLMKRAEKVLAGEEDEDDEDDDDEEEEEEEKDDGDTINFLKLHGNMTQPDRSAVFNEFRESGSGVLLCTDVAARGLDLPRVNWIVQYNAACTAADYVHRVGRTARVNAKGSAIAFLAPAEVPFVRMLQDHDIKLEEVKMNKVLQVLMMPTEKLTKRRPIAYTVEEAATKLQLKFETILLENKDLHELAKKSYISFVRSYASYPKEVRLMFNFKSLHLGHYAKSTGLREAPSALGASAAMRARKEMKEKREKKEKYRNVNVMKQKSGILPKYMSMSEFSSGLEDGKIKKAQGKSPNTKGEAPKNIKTGSPKKHKMKE